MFYTLRFFSSKCSLFHNAKLFGPCIIHILYTGCAKIKKNNSGAKGLLQIKICIFYNLPACINIHTTVPVKFYLLFVALGEMEFTA